MSAQTVRAITGDTFYGLRRQSKWSYMILQRTRRARGLGPDLERRKAQSVLHIIGQRGLLRLFEAFAEQFAEQG